MCLGVSVCGSVCVGHHGGRQTDSGKVRRLPGRGREGSYTQGAPPLPPLTNCLEEGVQRGSNGVKRVRKKKHLLNRFLKGFFDVFWIDIAEIPHS